MGGKAMGLINIETERKSTKEHIEIQNELIPVISKLFNTEVKTIEFYRNKETHGDLDLLILNSGNLGNVHDILTSNFGPVHSNGNVHSFEYKKYQIDVIPQPTRNWETAPVFFDWDPTGNLMGKIAHKFGLKYGFDGLVFPFRNFSGRLTKDIVISKDSNKIFEFLGFSFNEYNKGFDSLKDIFNFVINSKFFNSKYFLMENLSHIDRKRNQKRQTYRGFLEFVEQHKPKNKHVFNKDKSTYINKIDKFFPDINFKQQLEILKRKDKEMKEISEKFNGRLIMEQHPNLQGKELGLAIKNFREKFEDTFNEYVLGHTSEEIMNDFNLSLI